MSTSSVHAVILAGGRGTRFWPRSRTNRAKQVLEFLGQGTLIQQTVRRLSGVVPPQNFWILTNEHLRDEILKQLPKIPKRQVIAEPAQRNTAPAIGLAAELLRAKDPDAVMGVFPADHFITGPQRFLRLVEAAYRSAAKGKMVLLGIQPRWAETGYGYLEFAKGAMKPGRLTPAPIVRFREKPNEETAREYATSGDHCWNGGMFFWRADTYLRELSQHLPNTASLLSSLPGFASRNFTSQLAKIYPECDNISVDYAILEKTEKVLAIAADDIGWNDVGSWNAVYEMLPHDGAGNTGRGEALSESSSGNYVDAPGKLVALLGVHNLVIVDTPDALLICDRKQSQRVGELVKTLEKQKRTALL